MGGESLTSAAVTEQGLLGDRGWALRDGTTGLITDGKKIPKLMVCQARYVEEPTEASLDRLPSVAIRLPDSKELRSDDDSVDAQLSEYCGRPLTLVRRTLEEHFFDVHPLHILTAGTLAALQSTAPHSRFAPQRFRPNLLVESETSLVGDEQHWCGSTLTVGSLQMSLVMPTERCSMVMRAQQDIDEDAAVLRAVVQAGNFVGLYASVTSPGVVQVGQGITLIGAG
jgi:hypothetical protein